MAKKNKEERISRLFSVNKKTYKDFRTNCKLLGECMSEQVDNGMKDFNESVEDVTKLAKSYGKQSN